MKVVLILKISKKKTIFVKTVVFPTRRELTTPGIEDLRANNYTIV